MHAVNATIKILEILTKVVILLAFSEILPEASTETAKTPYLQSWQMEYGEISQIAKTSSTFGASYAKNKQNFAIFTLWSCDMLFLNIEWLTADPKNELLGNFMNRQAQSHDLHVNINRNDWQVEPKGKFH